MKDFQRHFREKEMGMAAEHEKVPEHLCSSRIGTRTRLTLSGAGEGRGRWEMPNMASRLEGNLFSPVFSA